MTYEEIQEKVMFGCDTIEEYKVLKDEILKKVNNLSEEEKEEMIDSGILELLSMIATESDKDS